MKYNKKKLSVLKRKYLKTSKNRDCGNISPHIKKNLKIELKGKGKKEKESYVFIVYVLFNIN